MHNSVSSEINVLAYYFLLGVICAVVFDIFKPIRFGKRISTLQLVFQDILNYLIISFLIFNFIIKVNGAEIRGYMICSAVVAFVLYRLLISRFVVRFFVLAKRIIIYLIKMLLIPFITVGKIVILPFLKIKAKLLSKKTKIALTFQQICFKIKCSIGMLWLGNKICKERKPCRRKQKPQKRV